MVGEIGFAAWKSSGAGEAGFDDPVVIEAARKAFFDFGSGERCRRDCRTWEAGVGWGARENEPNSISGIWIDPACQGGRGIGFRAGSLFC
ncbi:ribosomal-protein-alanine N-acetyltransferase [Rhizobium tibeticum]|uniref:hypothetical protein n=1 Tax=Rhizobium tibeticum TaxID=501024 RepID=UPI000AD3371E|nr:hypothetical protein [Rhizobium tibeticum]MDP9811741.1 ribosomal-protein-alanine N-acetyltransferase [Rhizobium tibeticum]